MAFEPAATLIGLREGLEAFLVTGILLGIVHRLGGGNKRRVVLAGAGLGLVAAVLFGLLVQASLSAWYDAGAGLWLEVATGAVALAILVYMVLWMYRHTIDTVSTLHNKVAAALAGGSWGLVGLLAFFVVFREGVEAVLFFAARAHETSWLVLAASGALGFALSALAAAAIFRLAVRINVRSFFAITGLLLILLSAGILVGTVGAVEELGESEGWFEPTPAAWDLRDGFAVEDGCRADADPCPPADQVHGSAIAATLHTLVGYEDHPSWAQVVSYALFVGGFGGIYCYQSLRPRRVPASPR